MVTHRAETRAAIATCALSGASAAVTDWMQLGPSGSAELSLDESARRYPRWVAAVTEALDLAEVPYQLLGERDLHKITSETSAVVAPTLRRIDGSVWGALHALGMTGMRVVLGPGVPREDEFGDSLGDASAMPQGAGLLAAESLDDLEGLAADLLGLAGELGDLWIAPESANATCTPFYDDTETVRLCFVRNRGSSELRANVNVPLGCVLRDGITGTCIEEAGGIAEVALLADEVRIFAVEASP